MDSDRYELINQEKEIQRLSSPAAEGNKLEREREQQLRQLNNRRELWLLHLRGNAIRDPTALRGVGSFRNQDTSPLNTDPLAILTVQLSLDRSETRPDANRTAACSPLPGSA